MAFPESVSWATSMAIARDRTGRLRGSNQHEFRGKVEEKTVLGCLHHLFQVISFLVGHLRQF